MKPGFFFVRYSIKLPNGQRDIRRKVLRLQGGRFTPRPDFYRRDTCGLLRSYANTEADPPSIWGT